MLRYIFLSGFALLLLTACGGSGGKESTTDGETRQKTEGVVKLDTGPINKEGGPITTEVGNDLDKLKKTNVCGECDLSGADLREADLSEAILAGANLRWADLSGAILDGVIGADFTGALNVPD